MFNKKKTFFKKKVDSVQKAIWDLEFKLAKSRQVREGVRQDRDRAKEALNQINAGLTAEKDAAKKEQMQKEYDAFTENVTRYEAQMGMIDKQINGFMGDEKHEPIVGILEEIKSYTELMLMYKEFISKL